MLLFLFSLALAFSFDVYLCCSLQYHLLWFSFFLAFKFDLFLSSGFLFLFLLFVMCVSWFPFSHLFINSFILFSIFLTFFPVSLLLSSTKLNFKVLLNLCHIIKLYFFNQVLAIDHVIFVVTLIIEVQTIDDLKFEMMRIFLNFFNSTKVN